MVPIYNKTDQKVGGNANGVHYIVPVGKPGMLQVPPKAAKTLAKNLPESLTLSRTDALHGVDAYAPCFTDAHRKLVLEMTEAQLVVVLAFLSAGKDMRKPKSIDKDLLVDRVLAWMVGEQVMPVKDPTAEANAEREAARQTAKAAKKAEQAEKDAKVAAEKAEAKKQAAEKKAEQDAVDAEALKDKVAKGKDSKKGEAKK